ncbi:MAG TPA: hypothetical protein GX010_00215 [Erysipelotrichaceae bacterium]|nr:hypothetical protein [Erysipelotrichaceae bacterium]
MFLCIKQILLRTLALSGNTITQFESDKLANEVVFRDDRQIIEVNDDKEFFINP